MDSVKKLRKSAPYPAFRRSIIMDKVHPSDLNNMNMMYACEDCSYYIPGSEKCAMDYKVKMHLRVNQLKLYELTGRMAICRAHEVD